jgi:hypothetical protein
MVWLIMLACNDKDMDPCGDGLVGCTGGDDTATGTDDSSVDDSGDDTGNDTVCHGGNEVLVEAPKKDGVAHWEWSAEPSFTKNGGVVPDEDAPSITVTCPTCVEGTTEFQFEVDFRDKKDQPLGFAFTYVQQVCD